MNHLNSFIFLPSWTRYLFELFDFFDFKILFSGGKGKLVNLCTSSLLNSLLILLKFLKLKNRIKKINKIK